MHKLRIIKLVRVQYVPKTLEPGILYVSDEFGAALHLCACGCNTKVSTPLGPTEWALYETSKGPTLQPSVGNWQLSCKSHYWIQEGEIIWLGEWSQEQIVAGRESEQARRQAHYETLARKRNKPFQWLWRWLRSFFE